MALNQSTDAGLSQRTNVYAERQMLRAQAPVVVLDKFGTTKPMPKNKGVVIKFRRPKPFSAETTPLVEGVTPPSRKFEYEDVSATLKQYGMVSEVTDVIEDTHEDPVLQDLTDQLGKNAGRTIEALTYGVVRAGTNVFYTNGTQRTDVNTPITLSKQRAVTRGLQRQKAEMLTKVLDGSPDYGTFAVEAAYIGIAHTDLESDLRNIPGFKETAIYGQRKLVHEREIGSVENVRYVLSPDLAPFADGGAAFGGSGTSMVTTTGTSADVYPILYLGSDAYGTVPLRGQGAMEPTIIPVNQKTKDDPLGQRGVAGWKTWFTAVILNQLWMARMECAVTAL